MKRLIPLLALAAAACSGPAPVKDAHAGGGAPAAVAKGVVETQGGLVRVLAPRDGVLDAVLAEEGERVAAGQPLARLDDRQARLVLQSTAAELSQRQAEVEVATAKAAGAEREARRLRDLAAADAATRQDAEQAATGAAVARGEARQAAAALQSAQARRQLNDFEVQARTVRAPSSGAVLRRYVTAGSFVTAATPLFAIEAEGPRVVRAELDESFSGKVLPGATAAISPEFQSGPACTARVLRVSNVLTAPTGSEDSGVRPDTRVVTAVLALPPGCDLRLGQRVLARFGP